MKWSVVFGLWTISINTTSTPQSREQDRQDAATYDRGAQLAPTTSTTTSGSSLGGSVLEVLVSVRHRQRALVQKNVSELWKLQQKLTLGEICIHDEAENYVRPQGRGNVTKPEMSNAYRLALSLSTINLAVCTASAPMLMHMLVIAIAFAINYRSEVKNLLSLSLCCSDCHDSASRRASVQPHLFAKFKLSILT